MPAPRFPNVVVCLSKVDPNAPSLVSRVTNGLNAKAGLEVANEFEYKAFRCSNYHQLLSLVLSYVVVE